VIRKSLVLLLVLVFPVIGMAAKPIQNLVDVPVPVNVDATRPSLEDVRTAIISACQARGWTPVLGEGNTVLASILVRSTHYAEIEISYTESAYSITYVSSRNLDYNEKKQKIHRNYNNWVNKLSGTIQREFGVRSQVY
jgi:hypothetical protein